MNEGANKSIEEIISDVEKAFETLKIDKANPEQEGINSAVDIIGLDLIMLNTIEELEDLLNKLQNHQSEIIKAKALEQLINLKPSVYKAQPTPITAISSQPSQMAEVLPDTSVVEPPSKSVSIESKTIAPKLTTPSKVDSSKPYDTALSEFLAKPTKDNLSKIEALYHDKPGLAEGHFKELLTKRKMYENLLSMAVHIQTNPKSAKDMLNELEKFTLDEKKNLLTQIDSIINKAGDKETKKTFKKIKTALPSDKVAKLNQEKLNKRKKELRELLSEPLTDQSKPFLLTVPDDEFAASVDYFKKNPDATKVSKGTLISYKDKDGTEKKIELSFSFIKPKVKGTETVYAMANGEYLGEGAYGRVKLIQDREGRNFAVKIEGVEKGVENSDKAEDDAEKTISSEVGFYRGEMTRKTEEKRFKGRDIDEKKYTVLQLKQGSEIFQHIYTNILEPGHKYSKEEQDQKRRKDDALTKAQELILAFKCCDTVENLHNRNIIHGDLKPANFMANILGNRILVGSIDYGFSFKLAPGQKVIHHPGGFPQGTHERYMPPEVQKGKEKGSTSDFSFSSDVYSLGVMFSEDLTHIPKSISEKMLIKDKPEERMRLPEVKKALVDQLRIIQQTNPDPEILKIIQEYDKGVKRMEEDRGPSIRSTLVAQMMSGYRDPREVVGNVKSTMYTTEDFKQISTTILARIGALAGLPREKQKNQLYGTEEFFKQLANAYRELKNDDVEDKLIFLHNAELFVKELIKNDVSEEYLAKRKEGLEHLFLQIENDLKEENKDLSQDKKDQLRIRYEEMKVNIEALNVVVHQKNGKNKEKLLEATLPKNLIGPIDLVVYVDEDLANNRKAYEQINVNAKALADDLFQRNISFIRSIKLSDLDRDNFKILGEKIDKRSEELRCQVMQDIILAKDPKHRAKVYEYYAKVAHECLKNGDYDSVYTILSGIQDKSIERLIGAGQLKISKQIKAMVGDDLKVVHMESAFKAYRKALDVRRRNNESFIPLFTVFVKDCINVMDTSESVEPLTKVGGPEKDNEDAIAMLATAYREAISDTRERAFQEQTSKAKTNLQQKLLNPTLNESKLYDAAILIRTSKSKDAKDKDKIPAAIKEIEALKAVYKNPAAKSQRITTSEPVTAKSVSEPNILGTPQLSATSTELAYAAWFKEELNKRQLKGNDLYKIFEDALKDVTLDELKTLKDPSEILNRLAKLPQTPELLLARGVALHAEGRGNPHEVYLFLNIIKAKRMIEAQDPRLQEQIDYIKKVHFDPDADWLLNTPGSIKMPQEVKQEMFDKILMEAFNNLNSQDLSAQLEQQGLYSPTYSPERIIKTILSSNLSENQKIEIKKSLEKLTTDYINNKASLQATKSPPVTLPTVAPTVTPTVSVTKSQENPEEQPSTVSVDKGVESGSVVGGSEPVSQKQSEEPVAPTLSKPDSPSIAQESKPDPLLVDLFKRLLVDGITSDKPSDPKNVFVGLLVKKNTRTIFSSVVDCFKDLNDADKAKYLTNLKPCLEALIKFDLGTSPAFTADLQFVMSALKMENDEYASLKEIVDKSLEAAKAVKEIKNNLISDAKPVVSDWNEFVKVELKDKNKDISSAAVALAAELQSHQSEIILSLQTSDFSTEENQTKGLSKVAQSFNNINGMVRDDLLVNATSGEHQKKILQFYVNVLKTSLDNNDYVSAMAILSAFNSSSVINLWKNTDKPPIYQLSESDSAVLKRAEELVNTAKNFAAYREQIKKVQNQPDLFYLPYLGLALQDITFSLDGNPTNKTLSDGKVVLNEYKFNLLGDVLALLPNVRDKIPKAQPPLTPSLSSRMNSPHLSDEFAQQIFEAIKVGGQEVFTGQALDKVRNRVADLSIFNSNLSKVWDRLRDPNIDYQLLVTDLEAIFKKANDDRLCIIDKNKEIYITDLLKKPALSGLEYLLAGKFTMPFSVEAGIYGQKVPSGGGFSHSKTRWDNLIDKKSEFESRRDKFVKIKAALEGQAEKPAYSDMLIKHFTNLIAEYNKVLEKIASCENYRKYLSEFKDDFSREMKNKNDAELTKYIYEYAEMHAQSPEHREAVVDAFVSDEELSKLLGFEVKLEDFKKRFNVAFSAVLFRDELSTEMSKHADTTDSEKVHLAKVFIKDHGMKHKTDADYLGVSNAFTNAELFVKAIGVTEASAIEELQKYYGKIEGDSPMMKDYKDAQNFQRMRSDQKPDPVLAAAAVKKVKSEKRNIFGFRKKSKLAQNSLDSSVEIPSTPVQPVFDSSKSKLNLQYLKVVFEQEVQPRLQRYIAFNPSDPSTRGGGEALAESIKRNIDRVIILSKDQDPDVAREANKVLEKIKTQTTDAKAKKLIDEIFNPSKPSVDIPETTSKKRKRSLSDSVKSVFKTKYAKTDVSTQVMPLNLNKFVNKFHKAYTQKDPQVISLLQKLVEHSLSENRKLHINADKIIYKICNKSGIDKSFFDDYKNLHENSQWSAIAHLKEQVKLIQSNVKDNPHLSENVREMYIHDIVKYYRDLKNIEHKYKDKQGSIYDELRRVARESLNKAQAEINSLPSDPYDYKKRIKEDVGLQPKLIADLVPPIEPIQVPITSIPLSSAPPDQSSGPPIPVLSLQEPVPPVQKPVAQVEKPVAQAEEPVAQLQMPVSSPTSDQQPRPKVIFDSKQKSPSPDRRKSILNHGQGHHTSSVDQVFTQGQSAVNDILNALKDEKSGEISEDNKKKYGIVECHPKKLLGEEALTIKMKVPKSVSGSTETNFDEHKTVDLYAIPKKEDVDYSLTTHQPLSSEETDLVIMQICKLAVQSAQPGTKYSLPEPENPVVKKALENALKERFGKDYTPGKLEVPSSVVEKEQQRKRSKSDPL